MTGGPRKMPTLSGKGREAQQARQDRLAKALRENLKKRKAQMRAREKAAAPPSRAPGRSEA